MSEHPLAVRVSEDIKKRIELIVDSINNRFPRRVSMSDVLRSAIEEYVKRDEEEKTNIFVKLPHHRNLSAKESLVLLQAMKDIQAEFNTDSVNEAVRKYKERLEYAEFLEWKSEQDSKKNK